MAIVWTGDIMLGPVDIIWQRIGQDRTTNRGRLRNDGWRAGAKWGIFAPAGQWEKRAITVMTPSFMVFRLRMIIPTTFFEIFAGIFRHCAQGLFRFLSFIKALRVLLIQHEPCFTPCEGGTFFFHFSKRETCHFQRQCTDRAIHAPEPTRTSLQWRERCRGSASSAIVSIGGGVCFFFFLRWICNSCMAVFERGWWGLIFCGF